MAIQLDPDSGVATAPPAARSRLVAVEIALTLLVVFGAELAFRAYVRSTPALGPPQFFNSSISSGKYVAFERHAAQRARTDVFLMGLSPMMSIRARRLIEDLELHGERVTAFNFAFPYHSVEFDRLLLRDIVLDEQRAPRVVVYGVMPLNLTLEPPERETATRVRSLLGFQLHETSAGARLRALALSRLQLFLYAGAIRDRLSGEERPPDPWAARSREFDELGDLGVREARPPALKLLDWEARKYKQPLRGFPSLLWASPLAGRLDALVEFCRQHGTRLLLVNTAVSRVFVELLPHGRADYDAWVQRMSDVAAAKRVPFLEMSGAELGDPRDFVDSHHLREPAAIAATWKIAAFLASSGLLREE